MLDVQMFYIIHRFLHMYKKKKKIQLYSIIQKSKSFFQKIYFDVMTDEISI